MKSKSIRAMLALPVLAVGVLVAVFMMKTAPQAAYGEIPDKSEKVEVIRVWKSRTELKLKCSGRIRPARQATITPQVSGRIVFIPEKLEKGMKVNKGQILARIEKADYEIMLLQKKAQLKQAEAAYKLELGQQKIALNEWENFGGRKQAVLHGEADQVSKSLALREPQLKTALSAVELAKAAVRSAELMLDRTDITCPFDAVILEKYADIGQIISPQSKVVTIASVEEYLMDATVSASDIHMLSSLNGAAAEVMYRPDKGESSVFPGVVREILPSLDKSGLNGGLLISVNNPLSIDLKHLKTDDSSLKTDQIANDIPLFINAFVKAEVMTGTEVEVIEIPSTALRDGSSVWLLAENSTLEIRKVKVLSHQDDQVLISEGLHDGDSLIISRLNTPIGGMRLRADAD